MTVSLSPKKLLHSKWTACEPQNKQKHFIVEVEVDEDQSIKSCVIEAVYSKQQTIIDWTELKQTSIWQQGWL